VQIHAISFMGIYKSILRPVLFLWPPEKIHKITFGFLNSVSVIPGLIRLFYGVRKREFEALNLMGLKFTHRVGMAAGLDKDGTAIRPFSQIGFSFLEIGTVTPRPQPGNPKPRLFRLPIDQALINRMGFNNNGVDALALRLRHRPRGIIIGGNIGKNTASPNSAAVDDYAYCFDKLYGLVDYFVVNVSCPNISDLRELQDKDSLDEILQKLIELRKAKPFVTPILLKISPDLNEHQMLDLIQVVKNTGIDGLVATNTSISRENLNTDEGRIEKIGSGGLSGAPLRKRSTEIISLLRKNFPAPFPIIASGGIMSPEDAVEKIKAGADLVQLYTGFIYEGPGLIQAILKKLRLTDS